MTDEDILRALIAADDEPCPGVACHLTHLGHLLSQLPLEMVDRVRELDPNPDAPVIWAD